jgi:hypothetical protein
MLNHMVKVNFAMLNVPCGQGGVAASAPTENQNIGKGVAPKAIPAMYASCDFSRRIEAFNRCLPIGVDLQTPVLIMQGGIDEDRLLQKIDTGLQYAVTGECVLGEISLIFGCSASDVEPNSRSPRGCRRRDRNPIAD